MRCVQIRLTIPQRGAAAVYSTLADFRRYPEFSPAVRSVTVTESNDTVSISTWEVNFRRGLLRWVEEDTFSASAHQIAFRQLEGDVAVFDGSWTCVEVGDDTAVTFAARLDMGIPSLADALEPIAARTLVDNTVAIVTGLFGDTTRVDDVAVHAPDAAPAASQSTGNVPAAS